MGWNKNSPLGRAPRFENLLSFQRISTRFRSRGDAPHARLLFRYSIPTGEEQATFASERVDVNVRQLLKRQLARREFADCINVEVGSGGRALVVEVVVVANKRCTLSLDTGMG